MADNKLELVVEVDVDKANASIKSINRGLSSFEQAAAKAGRGAAQGIDGFTVSVAKGAAAGALLASAFEKVVGWAKDAGLEIVKYAARTETLGVVTSQLAKVNGYEEGAMARLVERVKALGISTQEAHGVVQRMVFAQLDLSKATELARVAQDAAVISGVNSSEALEKIIIGITTGQTEMLHNMGLQVSLEQVVIQAQRELGRTLTEREKRAAMLNAVLAEGVKIEGTYEAAMGTAGKQMTSLVRLWQEAKNALGQEFQPQLRAAIAGLSELLKWVKDNADWIAKLAGAIGSAALGVAIGKFVGWIGGAKKAVDGLTAAMSRNWATLLITGAVMAGQALYSMYQDSLELEKQLKEQNKTASDTAHILYQINERGKTVDDLKKMGYSVDQIRRAFMGAGEGADEFLSKVDDLNFGLRIKVLNQDDMKKEAARQAQEMAREMGKKQKEIGRSTLEEAIKAEQTSIGGPGKALIEFADAARKASIFVDKDGNEHAMRLTTQTIQNLGREHAAKMVGIQKDSAKEILNVWKEEADARLKWDTELYQARIKHDEDVAARALRNSQEMYELEEARAGQSRDIQLAQAEGLDGQTLEQKVAVEQRKMNIEVEYLRKVADVRMKLFDLETSRMVLEEQSELNRLGYSANEIGARIAALRAERESIRDANKEATDSAVDVARQESANRTAQMIRDQNRSIFDSLKQQAGGVFDALLSKSQSVWSAIGNAFKTAMLTAIKEVVTSRVAAMLMSMFTGQKVSFAGSGGSGGGGGLGGLLGIGAVPIFGGGGGGAGGGGLFGSGPVGGNPMILSAVGGGGGGGATGGSGGLGGLLGMGGGMKSFLGFGGGAQYAPGMATTWQAATMGQKLSALGKSDAALGAGALLAVDGLRRGGKIGVAETTAGGALIGYKYGGALGAAIGAGVGFAAGIVRLFVKGATEKARSKIKATYGVDITDKGVLKQIVDMAKQSYGGNLDMAIRSQQVRDLVQLYAMSTGKPVSGLPATMQSLDMVQSGGSLYQANNSGQTGLGSLAPLGGGAVASNAPAIVVPLQIDSKSVGNVIIKDGRVVAQGAISAMKSNNGRRQMAALQLSPGLLTT